MKKLSILAATALLALLSLAGSCERGPVPQFPDRGKVTLEVFADWPAPVDGETRVTLDDGELVWENNERLAVLFSNSQDTAGGPRAILNSVSEGRFAGKIDLSTIAAGGRTMDDLRAIVVPADRNTRFECRSAGNRFATPCHSQQVQHLNGVLNGDNVPLFATVKQSDLKKLDNGNYTLSGVQLNYGCTLLEFNIYGTQAEMEPDELFKNIYAQCTKKAIVGMGYWTNGKFTISGNISDPVRVFLEEECVAGGRTKDNCIKLYAAVMPRAEGNQTPVLSTIKIRTSKALYTKSVNTSLKLYAGHVVRIGLDLSTFSRSESAPEETIGVGVDSITTYIGYLPMANKPIKIYTYVPTVGDITKMPILFAMHGSGRNAKGSINSWKTIAQNKKVIVVSPLFDESQYPNWLYQSGGVSWTNSYYNPRPRSLYTYNMIEAIFDLVKEQLGNTSEKYDLWGHSAGSQFSHRMTLNMPDARINRVVCSNAGYYTVPEPSGISNGTTTFGYPFSVLGMNMDLEQLKTYFARDLTVHLGTKDLATTLEEDDQLPVSPGAKAQGACRFERGHFFYNRAKAVADSLGFPFNWKLVEVEGVAHSGSGMVQNSKTGAGILLYGK